MHFTPSARHLAEVLPGRWRVGASNRQFWADGRREAGRIDFEIVSVRPFVVRESAVFRVGRGAEQRLPGRARWQGEGFRQHPLRELLRGARRWTISRVDGGHQVIIQRHRKTRRHSEGVTILVREGAPVDELRTLLAHEADGFGLCAEDFASLSWLTA